MQELPSNLLDEIVGRLMETLRPEEIYLFGSHAYGSPHDHSDVDLLVVVRDDAGEPEELSLAGRRALLDLPVCVDILVYPVREMDKWSSVGCSLPHTVLRKGKRLYAA